MLITCPGCALEQPEGGGYCSKCGAVLAAAAEWEFVDIVVPLNLHSNDRNLAQRFDQVVRHHLNQAAQGGWHPMDPVDWGSLFGAGRVKRSVRHPWYSVLGKGRNAFTWESVTIRLKRATTT